MVSELTCFLWLCLSEQYVPKKMLHHGAHALVRSPLIPLLRPEQQLARLERRGHRRTHTDSPTRPARGDLVQTGLGFCQKHLLTGPSSSKHLHRTRSPCLDPYVRGSPATGGPCLLSELLTPHGCFILGSRLNRMHLKN